MLTKSRNSADNNINKRNNIKIITSRTSSASILIKGSEICDAHTLRITGDITRSTISGDSWPTNNEGINTRKWPA
jgi:hypothetical protein